MNESSTNSEAENSTPTDAEHPAAEIPDAIDPVDLVYTSSYSRARGGISEDPREILSNPAVAPQTIDSSVEALRDDMLRDVEES